MSFSVCKTSGLSKQTFENTNATDDELGVGEDSKSATRPETTRVDVSSCVTQYWLSHAK